MSNRQPSIHCQAQDRYPENSRNAAELELSLNTLGRKFESFWVHNSLAFREPLGLETDVESSGQDQSHQNVLLWYCLVTQIVALRDDRPNAITRLPNDSRLACLFCVNRPKEATVNHQKLIDLGLLLLLLVGCSPLQPMHVSAPAPTTTPTGMPRPQPGLWASRIQILYNNGNELNLLIFFMISENGNQVESATTIFVLGPYKEGGDFAGMPTAALMTPLDISDYTFTWGVTYPNITTVNLEGTFVSPALLEGTFESAGVKGEWTAQPKTDK